MTHSLRPSHSSACVLSLRHQVTIDLSIIQQESGKASLPPTFWTRARRLTRKLQQSSWGGIDLPPPPLSSGKPIQHSTSLLRMQEEIGTQHSRDLSRQTSHYPFGSWAGKRERETRERESTRSLMSWSCTSTGESGEREVKRGASLSANLKQRKEIGKTELLKGRESRKEAKQRFDFGTTSSRQENKEERKALINRFFPLNILCKSILMKFSKLWRNLWKETHIVLEGIKDTHWRQRKPHVRVKYNTTSLHTSASSGYPKMWHDAQGSKGRVSRHNTAQEAIPVLRPAASLSLSRQPVNISPRHVAMCTSRWGILFQLTGVTPRL